MLRLFTQSVIVRDGRRCSDECVGRWIMLLAITSSEWVGGLGSAGLGWGAWCAQGALVNRGDSIKRRRRRQCDDSSPMKSSSSDKTQLPVPAASSPPPPPPPLSSSSCINDKDLDDDDGSSSGRRRRAAVRVVVLGDDEVGKTALLQQFMTSVYMAADVQTHFGRYARQQAAF